MADRRTINEVLVWRDSGESLETQMGKDLHTDPIEVNIADNVTFCIYHTAGSSPVGVIEIQARNQDTEAWITVDGSEVNVPVADGALMYRIPTPPGRWVRGFYTYTSGNAVISGSIFGKGD